MARDSSTACVSICCCNNYATNTIKTTHTVHSSHRPAHIQTLCNTGCIQNTETGFLWLSRTTYVHIHVFPGLFNWVDIEQVRLSYNTEYVTRFITILNNRSNRVWQWRMIMYVKAKNTYMGQKCCNHLVDFPGPRHNSMTFQAWKIWILNSMTFHNLYAPWQ